MRMSNYAIIHHNETANMYYIIQGKKAPMGYPEGVENVDWFKTQFKYLSIDKAQEIVAKLDSQTEAEAVEADGSYVSSIRGGS